jgi:hypothetical protein
MGYPILIVIAVAGCGGEMGGPPSRTDLGASMGGLSDMGTGGSDMASSTTGGGAHDMSTGGSDMASSTGGAPSFATDVKPILTGGGCLGHHMTAAWDGVNSLTANGDIIAYFTSHDPQECGGAPSFIKAGDAAHSFVYEKISGNVDPGCGSGITRMPLGGALSAAQIATVKAWIDNGAKDN